MLGHLCLDVYYEIISRVSDSYTHSRIRMVCKDFKRISEELFPRKDITIRKSVDFLELCLSDNYLDIIYAINKYQHINYNFDMINFWYGYAAIFHKCKKEYGYVSILKFILSQKKFNKRHELAYHFNECLRLANEYNDIQLKEYLLDVHRKHRLIFNGVFITDDKNKP